MTLQTPCAPTQTPADAEVARRRAGLFADAEVWLHPIVNSQYISTTLYQVSYRIQ